MLHRQKDPTFQLYIKSKETLQIFHLLRKRHSVYAESQSSRTGIGAAARVFDVAELLVVLSRGL